MTGPIGRGRRSSLALNCVRSGGDSSLPPSRGDEPGLGLLATASWAPTGPGRISGPPGVGRIDSEDPDGIEAQVSDSAGK